VLVCTLGDLTLDVSVRLSGPLAQDADTAASIHLGAGGQGANVAAWAAALGADARFIGKSGADEAGQLARAGLAAHGVDVHGPQAGRTGVICALVSSEGERSMASDRGAAAAFAADDLDPAWLAGCDHLFVSGYALFRDPTRGAARRAVQLAREHGAAVSVDLSSWSDLRDTGPDDVRSILTVLRPDALFANEHEARLLGAPIPDAALILKRGASGCSFDGEERAARPVDRVVDTTGAGDALAAGWIVGGQELALDAAARCIQELGSMPVRSPR
jgi:sugar/nucleoside kinase (ribokinase family)